MPHRLTLRGGNTLVSLWLAFSHLSGMAALSLGLGYFLLMAFATTGPVVEPLKPPYTNPKTGQTVDENPRVLTPKVLAGGSLRFSVDFRRHESCPGKVVETFTSTDLRSVIVQKRPTLSSKVSDYYDVSVTTAVPPAVYPGRWRYQQTVESEDCPGGRRKDPDFFTAFDFEVVDGPAH